VTSTTQWNIPTVTGSSLSTETLTHDITCYIIIIHAFITHASSVMVLKLESLMQELDCQ